MKITSSYLELKLVSYLKLLQKSEVKLFIYFLMLKTFINIFGTVLYNHSPYTFQPGSFTHVDVTSVMIIIIILMSLLYEKSYIFTVELTKYSSKKEVFAIKVFFHSTLYVFLHKNLILNTLDTWTHTAFFRSSIYEFSLGRSAPKAEYNHYRYFRTTNSQVQFKPQKITMCFLRIQKKAMIMRHFCKLFRSTFIFNSAFSQTLIRNEQYRTLSAYV